MDQDQPDQQMEEREAEKTADLESLADALAAFRQLHRDLDQWEWVHLARGLATVLSACYGAGTIEAALALTPEIERSPQTRLPTDPLYERRYRPVSTAWIGSGLWLQSPSGSISLIQPRPHLGEVPR